MKNRPSRHVALSTRIALAAALTAVLWLHPVSVSAALTWDTSTLTQIYNPGTYLGGSYYSYAPSVSDNGTTERIWSCHNKDSGVIRDHIFETKLVNGVVVSSQPVLFPSANGWDSYHNCDPSVVQGQFLYGGATYSYALFYLGNDVNGSSHNQIGVAFATNIDGPWVKYPSPLVTYPNNGQWGVGQPSVTSVDGKGKILLFYSKKTAWDDSNTHGWRREMDLSDMSNPQTSVADGQITESGLTNSAGNQDWLDGFDVAYDQSRDRFYMVREQHPYPSDNPTYIGPNLQVDSIAGSSIWNGGGQWTAEGNVTPSLTGFPRNHNGGLQRTYYGMLPDPSSLRVVFTNSCAAASCGSSIPEWTYTLWSITGHL